MIIPSIDLMGGKAVQLISGKEKALERDDPLALAKEFVRYGDLAVIDLDAALGQGDNSRIIEKLCRKYPCRIGGGIRTVDRAAEVLSWGADKVIIGTRAVGPNGLDHDFLRELSLSVGQEKVIIALDTDRKEIVTDGWRKRTGLSGTGIIEEAGRYASGFLFTQVEKEGRMKGTGLEEIKRFRDATGLQVTAAGGISTLDEIEQLSALGVDVQLGMALYTGKLDLGCAFAACCDWSKGLIPTIAEDASGQVLMLAYSSRESLEKAFASGCAWYFSRSRGRLWQKGEESGNVQELVRARHDCDRDALLFTVWQKGQACHTGSYSCFGSRRFTLDELDAVIRARLDDAQPKSYSASLSLKDVHGKIREECAELLYAGSRDEIIWEAADLLYFVIMKLARHDIPFNEVAGELARRRRAPKLGKSSAGGEKEK